MKETTTIPLEQCFACGRKLNQVGTALAHTLDGQIVYIGPECFKRVAESGEAGWQPRLGGPRLYQIAKKERRGRS